MPRVTSQKTRQYILTVGDPLDLDGPLPDEIQLFNAEGNSLMIGVGGTRESFEYETASLPAGNTESEGIVWAPSIRAFKIETDIPARVRIYATEAQMTADLGRAIGTKPSGDHGRLFEFVTTAVDLSWTLTPVVDMSSDETDGIFWFSITNRSDSTDTVNLTIHYVRTE